MESRINYREAIELLGFPGGTRLFGQFLRDLGWIDSTSGSGDKDIAALGYLTTELHLYTPTGNYAEHFRVYLTNEGIRFLLPVVEKYKETMSQKKKKK